MPIEKERVLSIHNLQEYEIRIGRKKSGGGVVLVRRIEVTDSRMRDLTHHIYISIYMYV